MKKRSKRSNRVNMIQVFGGSPRSKFKFTTKDGTSVVFNDGHAHRQQFFSSSPHTHRKALGDHHLMVPISTSKRITIPKNYHPDCLKKNKLGRISKEIRAALEVTQEQFADLVGVCACTIQRQENSHIKCGHHFSTAHAIMSMAKRAPSPSVLMRNLAKTCCK